MITLIFLLALSITAFAVEWEDWEIVDNISGDLSQVAMDVRLGKVILDY